MSNYAHLGGGSNGTFNSMMKDGFGVVTVMNARIFEYDKVTRNFDFSTKTADQIATELLRLANINDSSYICRLDTLKIANITEEGPTKTVTGGQYANPLIKYGKTARIEMQDALGTAAAIEALCGGIREWSDALDGNNMIALHFGQDFAGAKVILGDSFFIDRASGKQVKVQIIFYQMLPDSLFNLTQDAEGDATVFDMNGDLAVTQVLVGTENGTPVSHGLFYSIVPATAAPQYYEIDPSTGIFSFKSDYASGYVAKLDDVALTSGTSVLDPSTVAVSRLIITRSADSVVVVDEVLNKVLHE